MDVARLAGVSKSTVSRVIRGEETASPMARDSVLKAVEALNYLPIAELRNVSKAAEPTIGLLISAIDTPIFAHLNSYLHTELQEMGYHVVQETVLSTDPDYVHGQLLNLLSLHVDGLIIASGAVKNFVFLELTRKIPLLLIGRPDFTDTLHFLAYDEEHHAELIINHLAQLGHKNIIVQTTRQEYSAGSWLRSVLVEQRAIAAGINIRMDDMQKIEDYTQWLQEIISTEYTAVVCMHDRELLKTWRALRAIGKDAPTDLSLTGSDGIAEGIEFLGYSTIRKPIEEVAKRGAELIVSMIREEPHQPIRELFKGYFIPGRTTGPPRI